MSEDTESDPQERYFRPRPGAPGGEDEAEQPEGVAVGDAEATHVKVERQPRRTYAGGARPQGKTPRRAARTPAAHAGTAAASWPRVRCPPSSCCSPAADGSSRTT